MNIFVSEFTLEHHMYELRRQYYSFCLQALDRDFAHALSQEVLSGPFAEFFDLSTGVYQKFDVYSPEYVADTTIEHYPLMRELGDAIGHLVRAWCGRLTHLVDWQPNDIAVQRYQGPYDAIGRHRDFATDILLIASFTVCGYGAVEIYGSRADQRPQAVLQTGPGSLLLLAAPGLHTEAQDIRVTHAVPPPIISPRVSVTYRLATVPNKKGCRRL